jgi:ribose transport system ATP-binding protein
VGAKREIYNLIRDFAEKQGIGVLLISSELPELIGICDRLYIFREGTVSAQLPRSEFDREKILFYALPGVAESKSGQTNPISGNG